MKKLFLILAVAALLTVAAVAQTKKTEQAKAWKNFQTVIANNDKRAVASMIEFPLEASIVGKKSNFRVETETAFLKNYDSIFNRARRQKIARGTIVFSPGEDEFNFELLENGAYHVFTFRKIGGVYKLVGTMAAG